MTIVMPKSTTAGSWKHSDFPKPVAAWRKISSPAMEAVMTSFCTGLLADQYEWPGGWCLGIDHGALRFHGPEGLFAKDIAEGEANVDVLVQSSRWKGGHGIVWRCTQVRRKLLTVHVVKIDGREVQVQVVSGANRSHCHFTSLNALENGRTCSHAAAQQILTHCTLYYHTAIHQHMHCPLSPTCPPGSAA